MAYTQLRVHFVTATKNRRPTLTPDVEAYLYEILPGIAEIFGGRLLAGNGDVDHSHMLMALKASVAPETFIREVKAETSKLIRRKFPEIDFRWQRSFAAFSVSPWSMDGLIAYIDDQKAHHAKGTQKSEWELSG